MDNIVALLTDDVWLRMPPGSRISAITRFDNGALDRFGLPRTLPE